MNKRIGGAATAASLAATATLIATVLLASVVASTAAAGQTASVAGGYTYYTFNGGFRQASIAATVSGSTVKGQWSWQQNHGPVTCLVVDGPDAWLAGPGTTGPETGVFIYVHDGGSPGAGNDFVTGWGQDPGQPLEELLGWCATKNTDVPLFDMNSGNVTVSGAR